MEEVSNFRVKDSKTPGHPEFGWTPGIEATTGPLGQGVANGAGLAAAGKLAAATLNTPEHTIIDHHVVVLCGDGCLQEGIATEDVRMRFEAQGWEVLEIDGHDLEAITKSYQYAKTSDNGKPTLIVAKTIIGKGIDEIAGTCAT